MGDQLDPRIQGELERLNEASKVINDLENKLSDIRNEYRNALSQSTTQMNNLMKKLGDCVNKARPYYDAKQVAQEAQLETQLAAVRFERAVSMHAAAREMVSVAEQGMEKGGDTSDTAWQEMLNHATIKVNEAEVERHASDAEHKEKMEVFKKAEAHMNLLNKKLKFNIMRSRKYFELKSISNVRIQSLVNAVKEAEVKLTDAKKEYSEALKSLENISDSIHESRKLLGVREEGVGAEDEPQVTEVPVPDSEMFVKVMDLNSDETRVVQIPKLNTEKKEILQKKQSIEVVLSVAQLSQSQIP